MTKALSSLATIRVDFNFSDPCYVLKLAASPASGCSGDGTQPVVAALSNNVLKAYNYGLGDLRHVVDLCGHTDRINDISLAIGATPDVVVSCSDDSTARCWDVRSPGQCERCQSLSSVPSTPLESFFLLPTFSSLMSCLFLTDCLCDGIYHSEQSKVTECRTKACNSSLVAWQPS
jgi:WD40 repeat protein